MIRLDNGPELISAALDTWCKENRITVVFIQPGKPTQNGYVERYNGSIRRELLNAYLFQTLFEVRYQDEIWSQDYNEKRPHKSLGYVPPAEYRRNPDPIKLEKSNAKY
jgi:putative transposase